MHPIFNRGFFAETLACLFLTGAGFAAGWAIAPAVLGSMAHWVGVGAVMMTSPTDAFVVSLKLAFPCAMPGVVTWVALLIYRGRVEMRPPLGGLVLFAVFPWVVGIIAEVLHAAWVGAALASAPTYGVEVMISAVELSPGSWAIRAIGGSAVLLWVAVFWFSGRPSSPDKTRRIDPNGGAGRGHESDPQSETVKSA